MRNIFITESQFKYLRQVISEDVEYKNNGDGTINVNIENNGKHKNLDDRMFRQKQDILSKEFYKKRQNGIFSKNFYDKIVAYINAGLNGKYPVCFGNKNSQTAFVKKMQYYSNGATINRYNGNNYPTKEAACRPNIIRSIDKKTGKEKFIVKYYNEKEGSKGNKPKEFNTYEKAKEFIFKQFEDARTISDWAKVAASRDELWRTMDDNKIDRLQNYQNNDKVANYEVITLPNCNIKTIALFKIDDFNFTDALKHGELRQNDMTDNIFSVGAPKTFTSDDRETVGRIESVKGAEQYKKVPVTYDNGIAPNIANNFSLGGFDLEHMPNTVGNRDHFKQQYSFGDKSYTSISRFLDKSVQYASYALKDYGFMPSFILSVPSSSKYNLYYCTNLSNKLGVPYIKDFFQKNVVNVTYDKSRIIAAGFTEKEIFEFENDVRRAAFNEIGTFIKVPIKEFCKRHFQELNNIGYPYGYNYEQFIPFIAQNVYKYIRNYSPDILNDEVKKKMIANILIDMNMGTAPTISKKERSTAEGKKKLEDWQRKLNARVEIRNKTNMFIQQYSQEFINCVTQINNKMQQYANVIESNKGYELNLYSKAFKITNIEKRFRQYLQNVYIVKGDYTTKDAKRTGALLKQYANPSTKFLIFDEDINSGGSLLLTVNGFKEQLALTRQYEEPDKDFNTINQEIDAELPNKIMCLVNAYSNKGI